jgi:hypothetical protein
VIVKQTPPSLRAEGTTTRWLGEVAPGCVPEVLAVEGSRFMMEEFPTTGGEVDPGGLLALGALQRRVADVVDEVVSLGCPDRDLPMLASETAEVLERDDLLFCDTWSLATTDSRRPPRDFTVEDRERLANQLPRFASDAGVLSASLPVRTIVHGDFHVDNVALTPSGYVAFDWSNAAVGHPLLDISMWEMRSRDPQPAIAAYLDAWSAGDDLAQVWSRTRSVADLWHAVTCARLADAMVDPDQGSDWAAAVQKLLLAALDRTA